jgi:recombinational DNA repair protein RecT
MAKSLREYVQEGFYDGFASPSIVDKKAFGAAVLAHLATAKVDVNGSASGVGGLVQSLFQIGLTPSAHAGLVWVVPYGGKPTICVGYKGYLKLGWDAGYLARITPQVVLTDESFEWIETSEGPVIRHSIPAKRAEARPDNIDLTYVSWSSQRGYHNAIRVEGSVIRGLYGRASGGSPWKSGGFLGMVLKTPIRAAAKFWDCSAEVRAALAAEDESDEITREIAETPVEENGKAVADALAKAGLSKESTNE